MVEMILGQCFPKSQRAWRPLGISIVKCLLRDYPIHPENPYSIGFRSRARSRTRNRFLTTDYTESTD